MFKSLKNFRPVGGRLFSEPDEQDYKNIVFNANKNAMKVYRSARPDKISEEDLCSLNKDLGIRTVLDFRNYEDEYTKETGLKLLDNNGVQVANLRAMEKSKQKKIIWKDLNRNASERDEKAINHIIVGFYGHKFFRRLILDSSLPLHQKLIMLVISLFAWAGMGVHYLGQYLQYLLNMHGLFFLYKCTVDFCGISIRSCLQLLNNPENLPCMICCHAGKDRTGIISAILLSICGYDFDTIASDYQTSEIGIPMHDADMVKYSREFCMAPRDVMLKLLHYIKAEYGSVSDYLVRIGFSLEEQKNLKKLISNSCINKTVDKI